MIKTRLFGNNIEPACTYCSYGRPSYNDMILCQYKGVVEPFYSCRRFNYTPLKRQPKCIKNLPTFSQEDFNL